MKNSNVRRTTRIIIGLACILVAFVVFVNALPKLNNKAADDRDAMLAKYGLGGLSIQEIVLELDRTIEEPSTLVSGITGKEFVIYDGDKEYTFDLPKDSFYLSFAPYIDDVHPCVNHNLTTCRGEIMNQEFDITIMATDGTEILRQKMMSMDNGFIGVWLPSNMEANLQIDFGSRSVNYDFSTFEDSDTCLTTPLQLS